jgi:hypothetical protein
MKITSLKNGSNQYMAIKIAISTFLLFFSLVVAAQEDSNSKNIPNKNGHQFIPGNMVTSPFLNSFFNSKLGLAQSKSVEFPLGEVNGSPIYGETGGILFAVLGFDYQQNIKDWMAFKARINISARLGTEIQSLWSLGINSISGYELSWNLRISDGEKHMLSGAFLVKNFSGSFISISGFLKDVVNGVPNPSITQVIPSMTAGVGLRYAYGFNDLWGINLSTDVLYGEGFARQENSFLYGIGGALDLNLYERTSVPIGFLFEYSASKLPDVVYRDDRTAHYLAGKIAFTGSDNYSLGLEISYLTLPLNTVDSKIQTMGATLTSKFFFN